MEQENRRDTQTRDHDTSRPETDDRKGIYTEFINK